MGMDDTSSVAKALETTISEVTFGVVTEKQEGRNTTVSLHVAEGDMGKVIGKQGRIAKAIRTVVKAANTDGKQRVDVEID